MALAKGFKIRGPKGEYVIEKSLKPNPNISHVYLAYAHPRKEWVAVKLPVFSPDRYFKNIRRLEREIAVLKTVKHPNMPELVDSFYLKEQRNDPCAVEEYVRGGLMFDTYKDKPASISEAAQMMISLIDATSALHNSKIILRDLNPRNILMEPKRGPVIIDFNIAYRIGEPCGRSGTDYWSAPEQLDTSFAAPLASAESDIYALAATFVFLVTGHEPSSYYKQRTDLERVHRHLISAGCKPELANHIVASLSFYPSDRDCTLDVLKMALTTARHGGNRRPRKAALYVEGTRFELHGDTEVGRSHRCENCEGKAMIYVDDSIPYVEKHSLQIRSTSESTSLVALPGKNSIAVRKNRGRFTVIPTGKVVLLEDGDEIALAYNEGKGPYKVLKYTEE